MKHQHHSSLLVVQITLLIICSLGVIWTAAFYELRRSHETITREAELRTVIRAQVFAEYSLSTIKRIDEFLRNLRDEWNNDWQTFSVRVRRAQENIDDLVFQVSIIDEDGLLVFSNLAKPSDRTDLSEREHFRIHKDGKDKDRLFISRPLKGKVSGKWSIQFTRPIFRSGRLLGVIVVSVGPDQFASFAEKLGIPPEGTLTVVRNTGEVVARYPGDDNSLGRLLSDRPFLDQSKPLTGNYRQASQVDGTERIWGYSTLPDYGMSFVMGEKVDNILAPYRSHRLEILGVASFVSLMALFLLMLLYRSLHAVGQAKQQLAEIFALSPDGFVSFDRNHRVSQVSPAFSEMTALPKDALIGLDEDALSERLANLGTTATRFPGISALRSRQVVGAGATARNRSASVEENPSHRIELAGASQRVIEVGLRLSQTQMTALILYCRDVTRETEVDRMKSEFLSTAAHELRTPMASIYGFTELLLNQPYDGKEQRELLTIIFRQTELMIAIINELLDLARIESRQGKDFDMQQLDLLQLLGDTLAGFNPPPQRAPPLRDFPAMPCWVRADKQKLTQAISNILSNAYKYSPQGGDIAVALIEGDGEYGVRIADFGIGMTPDQVGRIYERFYRADTTGMIPGTGLGMSIVKEIIDLHDGRICITSQLGVGTTMTLWLSRFQDEPLRST